MRVFQNSVILSIYLILNNNTAISISTGNVNFNASLRNFSAHEDENSTNVRTLQKEPFARYANFAPVRNHIKFKEISDNALSSSSSRGRGLHHDHHGYGLIDYEDHSHYGPGYDHHLEHGLHDYHEDNHGHHNYHDLHHYSGHHSDHYGHGYHHKHIAHALAAKTILWPIAGIALLGAAAALATNPVLLQLGVVSGRRKRRETNKDSVEFDSNTNWFSSDPLKYLSKTQIINLKEKPSNDHIKDNILSDKSDNNIEKRDAVINRILSVTKRKNLPRIVTVVRNNADSDILRNKSDENTNFIPILLKANNG